ncbi:MAG: hypothetical protein P8Y71_28355, partial [Pseudolabrys sp.]
MDTSDGRRRRPAYLVGVLDHLRHVEPVEFPVLVERKEVGQVARLVPVVRLKRIALDLGHPVDELSALAVDVVDDRIDHQLAGEDRADAHIGAPVQDRLAPRDAAPGVDAGEDDFVVRIEVLANGRVDALAVDHHVGADALAVLKVHGGRARVLFDAQCFVVGQDGAVAQPLARRLIEDHMQLAAVDADLRVLIAGELAARLLVDELAEAVVEAALAVLDAGGDQAIAQSE